MAARLITIAVAAALAGIFSLPSQPEPPKKVELTMASVSTATPFQLGGFDIRREMIGRGTENQSLDSVKPPGIPERIQGVDPNSLFNKFMRDVVGPDSIRSFLFSRSQRPESLLLTNRFKKKTSSRPTQDVAHAFRIISFFNPLLQALKIFGGDVNPSQNVSRNSIVIIIQLLTIEPKSIHSTAVRCGGKLTAVEEGPVLQLVVNTGGRDCSVILEVEDRAIELPVPPVTAPA